MLFDLPPFTIACILIVAIILLIAIIATLYSYITSRFAQRKQLERLAAEFDGEIEYSRNRGIYMDMQYDDHFISVRFSPRTSRYGPGLIIEQISSLGFKLIITGKDAASRTMNKLRGLKELKTGHAALDDKYVIASNNQLKTMNYLQNTGARDAIAHLLDQGFISLKADSHSIQIEKKPYKDSDTSVETFTIYLDRLSSLSEKEI